MNKNKAKIKTRIFMINYQLKENDILSIADFNVHHLYNVLRCKPLDYISLFNEHYGEFLAQIIEINKKEATFKILNLIKPPIINKFNIHLAYAPLKKDANDYVIEKSCELGVNEITQIITKNTTNKPLETDKLFQKLVLSSRQCERLSVPKANPSSSLTKFIENNKNNLIIWLYERENTSTLSEYLLNNKNQSFSNIILLIGPEGGFAEEEVKLLKSLNFVKSVYLNTNILRAETACLAAIINFQVICCNL